ncbi:hypothetical protein BUC_4309 [Burkholderia pseudomallei 576]|nr:hypothetical protein BUC_4309 [Burkholderia pseudomallei 576]
MTFAHYRAVTDPKIRSLNSPAARPLRRRGIHESSDHQRREKERTGRYVISQTGRPAILAKGAYASAFRIVQNRIKKDAVESRGKWFHRRRQPGLSLFLIHSFKFHQSVLITIFQRRAENNDLIPIQRIRSRPPIRIPGRY